MGIEKAALLAILSAPSKADAATIRAMAREIADGRENIDRMKRNFEVLSKDCMDSKARANKAEGALVALRELHVEPGKIDAAFGGEACKIVAALAVEAYRLGGGRPDGNYVEMRVMSPDLGPIVVRIERCAGKTPHALRAEAELEATRARNRLADVLDVVRKIGEQAEKAMEIAS